MMYEIWSLRVCEIVCERLNLLIAEGVRDSAVAATPPMCKPRRNGCCAGQQRATIGPVFADQLALSHATWLLTYPIAGRLGSSIGLVLTVGVLALMTLAGAVAAWVLWPARDLDVIEHKHVGWSCDHHRRGPQEPQRTQQKYT
jgi:hypothetical protein